MSLSTLALILVFPINVFLNIVLVHHTSLRLLGSPLALSITYWLAFIILVILTMFSPQHKRNKTWEGLRLREALDPAGIWRFLGLALPGILMVGTEWRVAIMSSESSPTDNVTRAAFEIVALAAGRLGSLSLAAQSVIMTTDQSQSSDMQIKCMKEVTHLDNRYLLPIVLNTLPFGIGVATSARVGNLIGGRQAEGAKHAGHAAALLSALVGAVVMSAMLASKDVFGYIFSDDEEVVRLVSKVMPLVASFQVSF